MLDRYDLKREAIKFTAAASLLGVTAGVGASGIPVFDAANWVENIRSAIYEYESLGELIKTVQTLRAQLEEARRTYAAITTLYNYGRMMEGEVEREKRRWMPQDWQGAMAMTDRIAAGEVPGDGFARQVGYLQGQVVRLGNSQFLGAAYRGETMTAYRNAYGTAVITSATAEGVYNDAHGQQTRIEYLMGEIDRTPDLKASVDLQSRIQAETALQLARQNHLKAIEMQLAASNAQDELAAKAAGERFLSRPNTL